MKKIIFTVSVLLFVAILYFGFATDMFRFKSATDFASCVAYGNPVTESNPRQCRSLDGNIFTEDLGLADLIKVDLPTIDSHLSKSVKIKGQARGTWFFEASFPITLETLEGKIIAKGHATTSSDWMTEEFISFTSSLSFSVATDTPGFVVLKKDNPSGKVDFDREVRIPVVFLRSDIIN